MDKVGLILLSDRSQAGRKDEQEEQKSKLDFHMSHWSYMSRRTSELTGGANQSTLRRTKLVEKHAPAARVQRFVRRRASAFKFTSRRPGFALHEIAEPIGRDRFQ